MAKYLANKIFPTKVKKAIFYSYVQNVSVMGIGFMDIAGKPFSQINMMELFLNCLNSIFIYCEAEGGEIRGNIDTETLEDVGNPIRTFDFDFQNATIREMCDFIIKYRFWFDSNAYGGYDTDQVFDFLPKYLEIMDILESGEVYKGLKMS